MQKKQHIPVEIELLIVDFLNGVINRDGLSKLNEWLSGDEEHVTQFNLARTAWIASGRPGEISNDKTDAALSDIKDILGMRKDKRMKPFWTLSKIAASWFIFMLIGGALNYYLRKESHDHSISATKTTISAPIGSRSIVDLPDGTKVWLNAGSKLTYSGDYGIRTREVSLAGEAYFSVKTNKAVPFLVKTTDVTVKALGTKFNVKAYPEEEVITATLEEGSIEVTSFQNRRAPNKVTLKPHEMITFARKPSKPQLKRERNLQDDIQKKEMKVISNVNIEPLTSWKDETWTIDAQPLGTLAPILERRYNIQISFSSEEISSFRFTSKIENETIEQIMSALELSAPVKYKMERNHLYITIDNNRISRYRQNTN
jgi:transmembrane sensor